jgi:hypothetical protein
VLSLIFDTKDSLHYVRIYLSVNFVYPASCEGLVTSPTESTMDFTYSMKKDVSRILGAFIGDL